MNSEAVLTLDSLSVDFLTNLGAVHAVRDATFEVGPGRICGLVGESGSGKTVTGLAVAGLVDRGRTEVGGRAVVDGDDVTNAPESVMRKLRGRKVGVVFQDPMTALNPLLTIGRQVSESIELHLGASRRDAREQAIEVLRQVGMPDPARRYSAYPHQLSGGLRQRAMIAVAIACRPVLLIADEPTTALDVTIQAQILKLLRHLTTTTGMGVVLITHDLGVVAQVCDDIVVMYAGEVVERGITVDVLHAPQHPYTQRLLEARPRLSGWGEKLDSIPGRVPPAWQEPEGCLFLPRCRDAIEGCQEPQHLTSTAPDRSVRCWRAAAALQVLQ